MVKWGGLLLAMITLGACANNAQLTEKADLGPFQLGHLVVIADDALEGPLSRNATEAELENAVITEVNRRFGRYQGGRFYNMGIAVDGFVLAQPGIPVVLSQKSAMFAKVTLWDDTLQKKLNEEPKQIVVFETLSGNAIIGSGLTLTAEEQLANISQNLVKEIEDWMANHPEWFDYPVENNLPFVVGGNKESEGLATGAPVAEAGDAVADAG